MSNVSQHGFWVTVDGQERYLAFDDFPWFREATIAQISAIQRPGADHLYWPELDVDLTLDSIDRPGAYPLVSRRRGSEGSRPDQDV